jgi:hypothetical protein
MARFEADFVSSECDSVKWAVSSRMAGSRCKQMSDHDKNLFIEQHKDGYAILRGGVKEPLAIEPTQDAAIEKARKLDPDAAIHVERVRNVEGGSRDKWRRI